MSNLTINKLRKFIKARRNSGLNSNMQFQIDAEASGFSVDDLGEAEKFSIDGYTAYRWKLSIEGHPVALIEFGRLLYLDCDRDKDTVSMMRLMEKAVPVPVED